jgi:hypothetical protein
VNFVVTSSLTGDEIGLEPAWKVYISGIMARNSQGGMVRCRSR